MQHVNIESANLNLMVVLDALLESRSVTRAAERLGLTQPAVSHALARLRELLRDPLLVRGRGGLVPTPRAQSLAAPLRQGLNQLEQVLRHEGGFDPASSARRFSIATVDYPHLTGLRTLLARLQEQAPGVSVESRMIGPRLAEQLESGELDVALAGVEVEAQLAALPGMRSRPIVSEELVCVARKGNPLLRRGLDLETYLKLGHVTVMAEGGACDQHVDVSLRRMKKSRRIAAAVPHFIAAPLLVAESDYISTLPRALVEYVCTLLPLKMHTPPLKPPRGDAYLWWHDRFSNDPAHTWWREQLMQAFAPYRR